jgi:hypothetical protein
VSVRRFQGASKEISSEVCPLGCRCLFVLRSGYDISKNGRTVHESIHLITEFLRRFNL